MILCSCFFTFELHGVSSLKGRRSVTNALKAKLKAFNVSVLDVSGEYPCEAQLVVAFLSTDGAAAAAYRDKIEQLFEKQFPQWPFDMSYEEL